MSSFYGVDILRAYEVSWLNAGGKPEVAVLEIFQDSVKPHVDPWQLREFLLSLADKSFVDVKAIRSEIFNHLHKDPNFGESYVKLTPRWDFFNLDFAKAITPNDLPHKFTHGLRFICDKTAQPFIGTASLYTQQITPAHREQLVQLLIALHNTKHSPRSFTEELFNRHFNQTLAEDFVVSVNLNRRGGISFQSMRSRRALDFAEYSHREVLE